MTKTILTALALTAILTTALPVKAGFAPLSGLAFGTIDGSMDSIDKRSKPRVPGGSGCDDPRDIIEHPECRP